MISVQRTLSKTGSDDPSDLIHRSPGITAIYNELKTSNRNNILDLGSSSANSFNFFSRLSCHIHFEGVDSFLAEPAEAWTSGAELRQALDDYLSAFAEGKTFDIILTWDIFNYLDSETLHGLMLRLNRHSGPNTLLHSIKYMGRNLAAFPCQYEVLDQYRVKINCLGTLCSRAFPAMDTSTILKSMPGYSIEQTFMQQEGMAQDITEHVLRFKAGSTADKRREALAELSASASGLAQGAQPHRSYALENICQSLAELGGATLLDLGPKSTHSGDFFLGHAENFYVEDIMPSLLKPKVEGGFCIRQHALHYPAKVKFDLVLAWDLLGFCSPAQLAEIYQRLRPHLHRETQIFAFFYTGSEIPARPQKPYVVDQQNILLTPTARRPASAEDITAIGLLKVFHEFQLVNTYVLQPGMQRGVYEFVFQAKAACSLPEPHPPKPG